MSSENHRENLSYETVIPSSILLNEKIELSAVKLFAFVKGLSKYYGYCFATNEYLATLMKSSDRAVRDWLKQLKDEGYIEIETSKNGIHWQRHIYISDNFKKCLRKEAQFHPPGNTVPPPRNHSSTILEDYKKERLEESIREPAAPASAEASALADLFLQKIKEKKPDFKAKAFEKWALQFEYMMRLDKRSEDSIKRVISHVTSDVANLVYVQSAKKLREDFDRIEMKLEASSRKDLVKRNREYALGMKNKYPEQMKRMRFDEKFISNPEAGKEIPFTLPEETFKEALITMFGGTYVRRS